MEESDNGVMTPPSDVQSSSDVQPTPDAQPSPDVQPSTPQQTSAPPPPQALTSPSAKELTSMYFTRFGKVCFNYSILMFTATVICFMVACFLPLLVTVSAFIWMAIALLLVLLTLGFILLIAPDIFSSDFDVSGIVEFSKVVMRFVPILAGIGVGLCVVSAVLAMVTGKEKRMGQFVCSIVFGVIMLIMLAVSLVFKDGIIVGGVA